MGMGEENARATAAGRLLVALVGVLVISECSAQEAAGALPPPTRRG